MNFKTVLGFTLVLSVVIGCNKQEYLEPALSDLTVSFSTEQEVSKVTISPDGSAYKMGWDGDETARLVERNDAGDNLNLYASSGIALTGASASFSFSGLTPVTGAGSYNYDIIHPSAAVGSPTGTLVPVTLPANQTPSSSSADPAAVVLVGRSASGFDSQPSNLKVAFSHLAAYIKMDLKGLSLGDGETITEISVSAEDCDIAGALTYDVTDASVDYHAGSPVSTIKLVPSALEADPAGFDVWIAVKPFTLSKGKTLTIDITTTSETAHKSVLKAKSDLVFAVGKVTEIPAFSDTYTVTFNSNGGTEVASVNVPAGKALTKPADPTKSGDVGYGIYRGVIDPASRAIPFAGWYTDADLTVPYDFSSSVNGNITLYAKWGPLSTNGQHYDSMGEAITWVSANGVAGESYTVVVDRNVGSGGTGREFNLSNAHLYVVSNSATDVRTLTVKYKTTVSNGAHLHIGKNITITAGAATELFRLNGRGCMTLSQGSKVSDCNIGTQLGLFYINSNDSYLYIDGGEIVNNTLTARNDSWNRAAVINLDNGRVKMTAGRIAGNNVTVPAEAAANTLAAGAVISYAASWNADAIVKTGGVIEGNTVAMPEGVKDCFAGQQILATTNNSGSYGIYVVDDTIAAGTDVKTQNGWATPWELKKAAL